MSDEQLKQRIRLHEGEELFAYKCPAGKTTIGIGRNLDDHGISKEEAEYMLDNDIKECRKNLSNQSWYNDLDQVRKDVLVEFCFNIGYGGVLKFKGMIAAICNKDYKAAAEHMLDSLWARQVGQNRSIDMAHRMRTGSY